MKLRLLKFDSKTCAVCISMAKKRTVESIAEEYPNVEVINLCIADAHGESPEGSTFEEAYAISDVLEVTQLPTFIIQDERGVEFARLEGSTTLTEFRKAIEAVQEEIVSSERALPRILKYSVALPLG
jgi:thioredoxin-related protein